MIREIITTDYFQTRWRDMDLSEDDLRELEEQLLDNPKKGDVIPGLNGARKLRVKIKGRGKRGGGRVIYLDIVLSETIYLLDVYSKSSKSDLDTKEKNELVKLINELKGDRK